MPAQELITKADTGDIDAILELIDAYIDEQDWTAAIDWADEAAKTGQISGLFKAAQLHHLRAISLLKGDAKIYHLMMEDGKATYMNAGLLITLLQKKGDDDGFLSDELLSLYNQLLEYFRDGLYCEAAAYFSDETLVDRDAGINGNFKKVYSLLKDVENTRERALCGMGCFYGYDCSDNSIDRDEETKRRFETVFKDYDYQYADKTKFEERILDTAASFYALMLKDDGNYEKAVSVLEYAVSAVKSFDSMCALTLKTDYKKNIFGKWKYVGK